MNISDIHSEVQKVVKKAVDREITFDKAIEEIEQLDLSGIKADSETLLMDLTITFFAGHDAKNLTISTFGSTGALITKEKMTEFTKARLIWNNKIQELEIKQLKEKLEHYSNALHDSGYFDPEGDE